MSLTLFIRHFDHLDTGTPVQLVLEARGALIGRAPTCDWCLPDPTNYISSRHCEVSFRDGQYVLTDISTNGTYLNGADHRLEDEHVIDDGDVLQIGRYEIAAMLTLRTARPPDDPEPEPAAGMHPPPPAHTPVPAVPPLDERSAPAEPGTWSSPAPRQPSRSAADDVWGRLAADNEVDWTRGGFGTWRGSEPHAVAQGQGPPPHPPAPNETLAAPGRQSAPPSAPQPPLDAFLDQLGLSRADVVGASPATMLEAARALNRLVAGLVLVLEARSRARAQMGVNAARIEHDGNNPIKFTRDPQRALALLLGPPQPGYLDAERAIEDAFQELQTHQMAMLTAMQGALRATLGRFSPAAIRERAEASGLLGRLIPSRRDAGLWHNYEREFGRVMRGSDEAFTDVFAKEFRKAYEDETGPAPGPDTGK